MPAVIHSNETINMKNYEKISYQTALKLKEVFARVPNGEIQKVRYFAMKNDTLMAHFDCSKKQNVSYEYPAEKLKYYSWC